MTVYGSFVSSGAGRDVPDNVRISIFPPLVSLYCSQTQQYEKYLNGRIFAPFVYLTTHLMFEAHASVTPPKNQGSFN